MKYAYLSVNDFVPCQRTLRYPDLVNLLGDKFNPNKFEPIPVAKINQGYLMGGGHHRASIVNFVNQQSGRDIKVPAKIMEDTRDFHRVFEEYEAYDHTQTFGQFLWAYGKITNTSSGSLRKLSDLTILSPPNNHLVNPKIVCKNGVLFFDYNHQENDYSLELGALPSIEKVEKIENKSLFMCKLKDIWAKF